MPIIVQNVMKNICSWTPTLVVLIMFKKLYPNTTFKDYFAMHFKNKISLKLFVSAFSLQILVLLSAVLTFFIINNKPLNTVTIIEFYSVIPIIIMDLTGGALGEELGWRGYAINVLQNKYTPLMASLFVGVVWGFWHLPLMLLSGYVGIELLYYIVAFMVAIISFSVVITFFYNKVKNILIAMWMHFLFNFLMKIVVIDPLYLLINISIGYLILAAFIVILKRDEMLKVKE